jgi:hypothetical protein
MRSKCLFALLLAAVTVRNVDDARADNLSGSWSLTDSDGQTRTAVVETNGSDHVLAVSLPGFISFTRNAAGDLISAPSAFCEKSDGSYGQVYLWFQDTGGTPRGAFYSVTCYVDESTELSLHGSAVRLCPNGVLDTGEECDDGNAASGDCCHNCSIEPGCKCSDGTTRLADSDQDGVADVSDHCPATVSHFGVDRDGCSLEQFCAKVDMTTAPGRKDCPKMDWNNDEARLRRNSRDCRVDHRGLSAYGRCVPAVTAPCLDGFADCDGDDRNGCEIQAEIDRLNCGDCGNVCPGAANSQPVCLDSTCGLVCDAGRGDCDADPANGCETDLSSDTSNCGACNAVCSGLDPCLAGTCGCPPPTEECDGNPATVCETVLVDNPDHCGACGNACGGNVECLGTYCRDSVKLVFATSAAYSGNLGGVAGADSHCAGLAAAAGLSGTYAAWLSEFGQTVTASTRLTHASVPYVLVDGAKIADDWNDLTDGSLHAPIKLDENGEPGDFKSFWTGTAADGSNGGAATCTQWTDGTSGASHGLIGSPHIGIAWTERTNLRCFDQAHLYCFEQ